MYTNIVLQLSLTFAGIEYGFRVRCRNNKGWSQWSVDSAPMCTSSAPPDPVAGLENTSIMSRLLKMCWRVPKCNGKPVCQYEILHHSHYYHPETRRRRIEHDREERERAGNVSFHWCLPCGPCCVVCCCLVDTELDIFWVENLIFLNFFNFSTFQLFQLFQLFNLFARHARGGRQPTTSGAGLRHRTFGMRAAFHRSIVGCR